MVITDTTGDCPQCPHPHHPAVRPSQHSIITQCQSHSWTTFVALPSLTTYLYIVLLVLHIKLLITFTITYSIIRPNLNIFNVVEFICRSHTF